MKKEEIRQLVLEFNYNHGTLNFPKIAFNKPFKIPYISYITIKGANVSSTKRMKKHNNKTTHIEYHSHYYKFIKKTNPETFEYSTFQTEVEIYPDFRKQYTRIYISTIDDHSMNLWLPKVNKQLLYEFIKFYQSKRIIQSCYDEWLLLKKHFMFPDIDYGEYENEYHNFNSPLTNIDFH